MATITGNYVDADPTQWWTLDYTFADSKFTWSVTAHASHTSYWNSIYGLTVNVGGNSYYKGDIDWRNYTPNTVVYSGTTNLSDCTVQNGVVTLSVSGNFYYGTWSTDYRSSGSGTCAVDPPTVSTLTYTFTNPYSNMVVSGRSVITFTMKGTSRTGSSTITYTLFQDGSAISTSTGTSGSNKTVQVTAPSAGSHSYYYRATDGNGTTSTSGSISITTYAYTQPSFNSVSAVRWTTGTSSGTASDEGTYCKATANWNVGKVGTTNLTTTLKVTVNSTSSTTTTSGTSLYMGGGNLSADNSYTVTFKLYDNYTGEANGVVRTDTLTMGGRGLDFIYANGHYGIAVGQKATANRFDTNMPSYIEGVRYGNTALPYARTLKGSSVTEVLRKSVIGLGAVSSSSSIVYCKIATINITSAWIDSRVYFDVIGRGMPETRVWIKFQNANTTDPELQEFFTSDSTNRDFYLYKSATSTWELYCSLEQTYGNLILKDYYSAYSLYDIGGIPVTINMTTVSSLPSGYVQADHSRLASSLIYLNDGTNTSSIGSIPVARSYTVSRSNGLAISSQSFHDWGRMAQLTLVLNASSGSYSAGSNIFTGTLASGRRPITDVMGVGFYLGASYVGWLQTSGAITIRATGACNFSGGTATISWTYLW